jgi:uncharacterized protein YdcH (DUF465 family)
MPMREQLKAELIESDEDFRELYEKHQGLEHALETLAQKALLSEEDEFEEKRIKREKLRLKDQMEIILRDRASALAGSAAN